MTTSPTSGPRPPAERRSGVDPGVAWSVTLHVLSFPWLLATLIALGLVVSALDVELGSAEDVGTQRLLVLGFVVVALVPLTASAVVGLRTWRRRRRRGALAAGVMSIVAGTLAMGGGTS
jgi:hypothetical protein